MAKITGKIFEKQTGQTIEARVQVLSSWGAFLHPHGAILKVGHGVPFFYSDGQFEVDAPRGMTQILVERGTEYIPTKLSLDIPSQGTVTVDVLMERWSDLPDRGWHPGNTHIHYDENEKRPDERLRLDPRVEDLRVTVISILQRRGTDPASNKYPPGVLTEFCTSHHHVECGEESRHNGAGDVPEKGYGHIMLLRIKEVVEPVSRGYLVDALSPDYPPLCYACDEAHHQNGIVIWCHNGIGLEAPVAAALGKLDAFNLFDPYWLDPEYDIWYAMLNCGFKLPASTGSDWFICSANRVYAYTGGPFRYEEWIGALQAGRTFITNGPALFLTVQDQIPGGIVRTEPGRLVNAMVSWKSYHELNRVEIVWNGNVVAADKFPEGSRQGKFETEIQIPSDGWIAARLRSSERDSFFQPVYAHTSPVYVSTGIKALEQIAAAAQFDRALENSLEWVGSNQKYGNQRQRQEVIELFRQAQVIYRKMTSSS